MPKTEKSTDQSKNKRQTINGQLGRARIEQETLEARIASLENEARRARDLARIGGAARRFPGPAGIGGVIASNVISGVQLANLESTLSNARANLRRASERVRNLASELNNLQSNIPTTEAELIQRGCA